VELLRVNGTFRSFFVHDFVAQMVDTAFDLEAQVDARKGVLLLDIDGRSFETYPKK
jgi:hypothetical protein